MCPASLKLLRQNLGSQKGKRASRTVHRQDRSCSATGLASPDPALQEALPRPPRGSYHLELTLQPRASPAEERSLALGELCLSRPSGHKASHSPPRDGPDRSPFTLEWVEKKRMSPYLGLMFHNPMAKSLNSLRSGTSFSFARS